MTANTQPPGVCRPTQNTEYRNDMVYKAKLAYIPLSTYVQNKFLFLYLLNNVSGYFFLFTYFLIY